MYEVFPYKLKEKSQVLNSLLPDLNGKTLLLCQNLILKSESQATIKKNSIASCCHQKSLGKKTGQVNTLKLFTKEAVRLCLQF